MKKLLLINFNKFPFKSFLNLFSIICTAICISFIILTLSINSSFRDTIVNKIISVDGYLTLYNSENHTMNHTDYIDISETLSDDIVYSKVLNKKLIIKYKDISEGIQLNCIQMHRSNVFNLQNNLVEGVLDKGGLIIGSNLAKKLNVNINEEITLVYLDKDNYSLTNRLITGIFKTHIPDYDNYIVYADIDEMEYFFKNNNLFDSIVVGRINAIDDKNVYNTIDSKYYKVFWDNKHYNFINWLMSYDKPVKILLSFVFLICVLNLFASNYIDYSYRKYEIHFYNIIGMKLSTVKIIFLVKTTILALVGCFVGCFMSYIFFIMQSKYSVIKIPSNVYYMDSLPMSFDISQVILIILSLLLSLLLCSLISLFKFSNKLK